MNLRAALLIIVFGLVPGLTRAQPTAPPGAKVDEGNPSGLDVSGWPSEIQEGHTDFAARCAEIRDNLDYGRCRRCPDAIKVGYAVMGWR